MLRELDAASMDLAVALGAAYYGVARRGRGIRIRGGTARTYYLGVESAMPAVPGIPTPVKALCVVPFGMEEGTDAQLRRQTFGLVVGDRVCGLFCQAWAGGEPSKERLRTTLGGPLDGNILKCQLQPIDLQAYGVRFSADADPMLARTLREAVNTWRYRPLMLGEGPTPFCHEMGVSYRVR